MIDIYKMKLHERYSLSDTVGIMRVAGGWLYSNPVGNVFVPYHNEFQGIDKQKEYININDIAIIELQQKQPPEECIEWLKQESNPVLRGIARGQTGHIKAKKLLKYFKEINDSN